VQRIAGFLIALTAYVNTVKKSCSLFVLNSPCLWDSFTGRRFARVFTNWAELGCWQDIWVIAIPACRLSVKLNKISVTSVRVDYLYAMRHSSCTGDHCCAAAAASATVSGVQCQAAPHNMLLQPTCNSHSHLVDGHYRQDMHTWRQKHPTMLPRLPRQPS
jgi:hypothetical protein